jgi:hypothetical protein
MPERNKNANIIKELKHYVVILENKLNDIGYHYFLLTNNEFELDIEFIKIFFKNNNNSNNCNNSAKWIVFIILLLKRKIKYYENLNKKKQYFLITKVMTIIILIIILILVQLAYWLTLETLFGDSRVCNTDFTYLKLKNKKHLL